MSTVLPINVELGLKLDSKLSREIGIGMSGVYGEAQPYPHIVLDDFLPASLARGMLDHFPVERLDSDVRFEAGYAGHRKRQVSPEDCDAYCREAFHFFNSKPFLQFLEGLSSIKGLLPDPYYSGGGFHEIGVGGKLGVHTDFRINKQLHLSRRINVIIYLNEDWSDTYGGQLELWSRDMQAKVRSVAPLMNRCVIFNTDADSFHGHPDPLTTPPDVLRRSIALYYYTASKAIYDELPSRSTMYAARPGDSAVNRREAAKLRRDEHLAQWIPPAIFRYTRGFMRRLRKLRAPSPSP